MAETGTVPGWPRSRPGAAPPAAIEHGRTALRPAVALGAAILALLAWGVALQGARPLWEPDEGRYTAVALEMLRSGDWLTPRLHPEVPHLAKPPLTYWTIASSFALLGRTELAARLPGGLAFAATVLLAWALARRLGEDRPWLPALIYATSLLPFAAANVVSTDTQLSLWEAVAGLGFAGLLTSEPAAAVRWRTLMWFGLGLAFLTKGPPGLLPLLAFAFVLGVTEGRRGPARLVGATGLAVFLAAGLGWYVAIAVAHPDALPHLLRHEVLGRLTGAHDRNTGWWEGVALYLPVLLAGSLPWVGLARGWRRIPVLLHRATWRRWARDDRPLLLLVLWLLVPLGVLVAVPSRMPLYVLPLALPLSLLVARALPRPRRPRLAVAAVAAWVAVLLVLRVLSAGAEAGRHAGSLAAAIRAVAPATVAEVVVVNDVNWYGLSFHLGCPVAHVALRPGELDPQRPELVEGGLHAHHADRMLLVPSRDEPVLARSVACCGCVTRRVGQWRKFALYWSPAAAGGAEAAAATP